MFFKNSINITFTWCINQFLHLKKVLITHVFSNSLKIYKIKTITSLSKNTHKKEKKIKCNCKNFALGANPIRKQLYCLKKKLIFKILNRVNMNSRVRKQRNSSHNF